MGGPWSLLGDFWGPTVFRRQGGKLWTPLGDGKGTIPAPSWGPKTSQKSEKIRLKSGVFFRRMLEANLKRFRTPKPSQNSLENEVSGLMCAVVQR